MSRTFTANGNIKPSRIVKQDATADFKVLQATDGAGSAGDLGIGISQEGNRRLPLTGYDSDYAAIAGEEMQVYTEGDECFLVVGAAVTNGDKLKADSDGRGITASVSGDQVVARALQTATTAGQLIKVLVTIDRLVA